MRCLFFVFSCLLFFSCSNNAPEHKTPGDSARVDLLPKQDTLISKTDSLHSEITCPKCGFKKVELLPTDYCLLNYKCGSCFYNIEPKESDCCVFCSYGDKKCPSKQ
jgi:hypothetical protein